MESPPYSRCNASSVWANDKIGVSHGTGRLDSAQGWSARTNAKGQWWQMDAGSAKLVAGVRTLGRSGKYWTDPEYATPQTNPSAGLADGTGNYCRNPNVGNHYHTIW